MSLLSGVERDSLSIRRMIFHVVGKKLDTPVLLDEIDPPQHTDFFLDRVRASVEGNLFEFREGAQVEAVLRNILQRPDEFTALTQQLARDFQRLHSGSTSMGAFFVFELTVGVGDPIFALIKYDNEDVVRYILDTSGASHVPKLERFHETFVRKAEAMQKIALVRSSGSTLHPEGCSRSVTAAS